MKVMEVMKVMKVKTRMRMRGFLPASLTSLVSLTSLCAYGADQKLFAAPQTSTSAPVSSAGGLAQVTLSLVLVLAAVFAAAWVARRMRMIGRPHGGALKVLAEVAVGTKERVVLVQVHEQQVLVGVATGNVNVLHVLPAGTPVP